MNRALSVLSAGTAVLVLAADRVQASDPDVVSPLVSYQYPDSLADPPPQPNVASPLISYQFLDSLADPPAQPNVVSPLVSYQFFDWPGDENLTFESSASISYFFRDTTTLTVTGPPYVTAGESADYRATLGGQDVTIRGLFSFAQETPTFAGIGGSTLFVLPDAPATTVLLRATYRDAAGQLASEPFPVLVRRPFRARMTASAQHQGGSSYRITLGGSIIGDSPPFTFRWDTDADGAFDNLVGSSTAFDLTTLGGTVKIGLEVTDAVGLKTTTSQFLTIDKPPVANQPHVPRPPPDPVAPLFLNESLETTPLDPVRAQNGLIVITHGLHGTVHDVWLGKMAARIKVRLGNQCPNIVLFDWSQWADVLCDEACRETLRPRLKGILERARFTVFGVEVDALTEWEADLLAKVTAGGIAGGDFLLDILAVRPLAVSQGEWLADWVSTHSPSLINPLKPIHLIGHSAGGFAVGQCEVVLDHATPRIIVDRVTMLDTPLPLSSHLDKLGDQGFLDRYVSSVYGMVEESWLTPALQLSSRYSADMVQGFGDPGFYSPGEAGHGYSHEWYRNSIDGNPADNGFYLSPFALWDDGKAGGNPARGLRGGQDDGDHAISLGGFSSFGSATVMNEAWTVTEALDAGIYLGLTWPSGATTLCFRYRFSGSVDGDFLRVTWNGETIHLGPATSLAQGGMLQAEAPVSHLAGETGILAFTLVSRGQPGASLTLDRIAMRVSDDPDGDGLTEVEETQAGTNPLRYDTDGDGLDDAKEVRTTHTNPTASDSDGDGQPDAAELASGTDPLAPLSVFRIVHVERAASGDVLLTWNAVAGRHYSVHRSDTLGSLIFDTIANGIAATGPQAAFTDTTLAPSAQLRFYWVEVE